MTKPYTISEAQARARKIPSFKEQANDLTVSLAKNPLRKERMSYFVQDYGAKPKPVNPAPAPAMGGLFGVPQPAP